MSNTYKLVNPQINGSFKTEYRSNNFLDAGKKLWDRLSRNFTNNAPRFAFTIQNVKDGKYHNLLIEESIHKNGVKYNITELKGVNNKKLESHLKKFNKIQSGGKRKKYNDDFDFEDYHFDDKVHNRMKYNLIKNKTGKPLIWWWYYTPTVYPVESFFVPVFAPTIYPYIEIVI